MVRVGAPEFQNARVSVSSELTLRRGRDDFRLYRNEPLSEWFRDRLGERLGVTAEALSDSIRERMKQSPPLTVDGVDCLSTVGDTPFQFGQSLPPGQEVVAPVALIQTKPEFPAAELGDHKQDTIQLSAIVTEHGSLVRVRLVEPANPSPGFLNSSVAAASMWRFTPCG